MKDYIDNIKHFLSLVSEDEVKKVVFALDECIQDGFTLFTAGNGGSAACASHLAQDLGKGLAPSVRFGVVSLVDNMSWITAIANDMSYDAIFSEQLFNLAEAGDALFVISGSGNSMNIIKVIEAAKDMEVSVIGLLGFDGGEAKNLCDLSIHIPCYDMGMVEGIHSIICHYIPFALSSD